MTSRPLVILGIVIIVIAGIAAAGYVMHGRGGQIQNETADNGNTPATSTSEDFYLATSTPSAPANLGTSTPSFPIPGQKAPAIDTSAWLMSVNNKLGYSIEYPADLITGQNGDALTLAFPKNSYFHWPLLDDIKVTVSVFPHSCPDNKNIVNGSRASVPVEFILNGYKFTQMVGTDVGAGQLYTDIDYDLLLNGSCYRVELLDHGTNGAGFYVDDASLVQKYDAQHATDMAAVVDILNGMVGTLRILAPSR